ALSVATFGNETADARGRHHRVKHVSHERHSGSERHSSSERRSSYEPPYADIVVDGNSGRVLHASNPDSLRHPASITKIMTLYLLFEQLEAGKLKLDSRLPVSAHAAAHEPPKLGLDPGPTVATGEAGKAGGPESPEPTSRA